MAQPVIMPRQGQSVETCIITRWFKQIGETVRTGDILFSYETDKAAFDAEAPASGTLLAVFVPEGGEAAVLTNVAVIGSEGEDISQFSSVTTAGNAQQPDPASQLPETPQPVPAQTGEKEGRIRISPRAKKNDGKARHQCPYYNRKRPQRKNYCPRCGKPHHSQTGGKQGNHRNK